MGGHAFLKGETMKIKITMEYDGSLGDFEEAMGMDDQFELYDSIIWQLDYGTAEDRVGYHNGIKIEVNEEVYKEVKE